MEVDQPFDHSIRVGVDVFLTRIRLHQVAFRIDDTDRRPGLDAVGHPDFAVGVVDDWMVQLVSKHRFLDALGIFFVVELGGVDADNDHFVWILLLQPDQVGEEVQAINSTQSPEFQNDNFAAKILELDGLVRADGGTDGAVKLRR